MSYLKERKIVTREKRIFSLSHFNGTAEQLAGEIQGDIKQRQRTFMQINRDEVIKAVQVLSSIQDVAVIVHGVAGCSASGLGFSLSGNGGVYSTNLEERDTILGSDEKLRDAVTKAYREKHPSAIFIVSTPVVAINNDDINSVILELEDELNLPIISVYTDGFKTKTAETGSDIVLHGLLKYLVQTSENDELGEDYAAEKTSAPLVNVVSVTESKADVEVVSKLLQDIGIQANVLPRFASVKDIKAAKNAAATVVLNTDEGLYFAQELETSFSVPFIRTASPIGDHSTESFVLAVARALGLEEKANEILQKERAAFEKRTVEKPLSGKTVFLEAFAGHLTEYSQIVTSLGGTVEAVALPSVDTENRAVIQRLAKQHPLLPIIVGNGQQFEKANELSKKHFDYYVSENGQVAFASEYGTIPISLKGLKHYGYSGAAEIASAFTNAVSYQFEQVYTQSWLKRSGSWFVKQEVN